MWEGQWGDCVAGGERAGGRKGTGLVGCRDQWDFVLRATENHGRFQRKGLIKSLGKAHFYNPLIRGPSVSTLSMTGHSLPHRAFM